MRYKLLGNSGVRVSELCLGTMTFGEDFGWGASKEESRRIYQTFLDAGGNFIDTANVYTNGSAETLLGEFMGGERQRIVLATKYTCGQPANDPNSAGNHRKSMVQAIEGSLRRLKTDYIDLYWLHVWDFLTPVEEVMRAFDDLTRAGKILYAGISYQTRRPGLSRKPIRWRACAAGHRSSACRSSTTWWSEPRSGSCCPWRKRWASA